MLAFAFGVSLLTGIVFGAVPAWLATRTDPIDALRGSGRSTGDHSSFTRTALLVLQATLSVVLVAGATMLGRSLNNVEHQDFGFTVPDRVLVAINRPSATYTVPQLTAMYRTLEDRLNRHPGRAVRESRALQPADGQLGRAGSRRRPSAAEARRELRRLVGSRERALPAEPRHDDDARPRVHARRTTKRPRRSRSSTKRSSKRFFKSDEDPIGQHFGLDEPQNVGTFTIVGVVRDAQVAELPVPAAVRSRCSMCRSRRT